MLTPEQVAIRSTGIGASEVAALFELSPYRAPIDVWLEKLGRAAAVNDTSGPIEIGDALEGALVELLGRKVGVEFTRPRATFRHPVARHMLASPDAIARRRRGGEIKVVGSRMAHHWAGGLPDYVRLQAAQNAAVMGAEVWYVGALVDGTDFRTFAVERDRELDDMLVERIEDFWSAHVETREPPPVTDPEERKRYLLARYPGSGATRVRLANDALIEAAVERLRELHGEVDALERERAALELDLCEVIGDGYGIEGRWGKALWYPVTGKPDYKAIAEQLAGGVVPSALIEANRGQSTRVFRLYDPPKTTKGRRR